MSAKIREKKFKLIVINGLSVLMKKFSVLRKAAAKINAIREGLAKVENVNVIQDLLEMTVQ